MEDDRSTTNSTMKLPELLAPAGNWECVKAAVENGADAVYFGLEKFNARMRAENFTEPDLPQLIKFLHCRGVKGYVALNTLVFTQELTEAQQYLRTIIASGVDAVIVQDIGICRLIRHISPDFPIHASTQMTITTAVGVEFARSLGCQLVVLARECSINEIKRIQQQMNQHHVSLPLEVFVHGALCVAYSGQCLTSEALGGRSANRGECAQACRMPYELIADGKVVNLGDRQYLLSPQDLAGLEVLPDLVKSGVACLKIEGRLKSAEYVANITSIYRKALDKLSESVIDQQNVPSHQDQYKLEMGFSRGLYSGWLRGINNQELVHGRFAKKRGVYLGEVTHIRHEEIAIELLAPVKPGDGVVFDCGHPEAKEEGGRIYTIENRGKDVVLTFGKNNLNYRRIHVGDRVWKTSDPELDQQLRQSFTGVYPQFTRPINLEIYGEIDQPLIAIAKDGLGNILQVASDIRLVAAHTKPLTTEKLVQQLGRLGNTPFSLGNLSNHLTGDLMLPVSELNRMRREIVAQLTELRSQPPRWRLNPPVSWQNLFNPQIPAKSPDPSLIVLVRNMAQLKAAIAAKIQLLYCDFTDPRNYGQAVKLVRQNQTVANQSIWVAPPRIAKPGENWILQQVFASGADGYLLRNYNHLEFFRDVPCIGDFSLNIANPLTADFLLQCFHLKRLTASYDLNITQLSDLLANYIPQIFEVTIHQHIPMFHMEHCVFCAFLSQGKDYTDCGRPCEKYEVTLRDRVGSEHILQADSGCRNTIFNGLAQTGAEYVQRLLNLGLRYFRLEFVNETPDQVAQTILYYSQLLKGEITGSQLWRELKLQNQLGVTRGPLGLN